MKVFLTSDWHFDNVKAKDMDRRIKAVMPNYKPDVCILAGDMCSVNSSKFQTIIDAVRDKAKEVILVPGNHEFWGDTFENSLDTLLGYDNGNVHILYNKKVKLFDRFFAGTTMWYNWRHDNDEINACSMDYRCIKDFTPDLMYDECDDAIEFLETNIRKDNIVITHHAPDKRCMTPSTKGIQKGFYCDYAQNVINDFKPEWWMCGHTHMAVSYQDGGTRVLSNPVGFGDYANWMYIKNLKVDVSSW